MKAGKALKFQLELEGGTVYEITERTKKF